MSKAREVLKELSNKSCNIDWVDIDYSQIQQREYIDQALNQLEEDLLEALPEKKETFLYTDPRNMYNQAIDDIRKAIKAYFEEER